MVLGDVGSTEAMSFTVIGDTVNIASRLQSLTHTLKTSLVAGELALAAIRAEESAEGAALAGWCQRRSAKDRGQTPIPTTGIAPLTPAASLASPA